MNREKEKPDPVFERIKANLDATAATLNAIGEKLEQERIMRKQTAAAAEKRIKKLEELTGSWANSHGSFAEDYFYNSFEQGKKNFFGEKFDDIGKAQGRKFNNVEDEYDIVMYNGTSIAIIEVKYKAHENDVPKVLKKAETFKIIYPYYKDYKIYLGLASMAFYDKLEQACKDHGIAIIKQVGDTMVIDDGHLKVF
jgi:hypothetical protein